MAANISVRVYRPPQQIRTKAKPQRFAWLNLRTLPREQLIVLGLAVILVFTVGAAATQLMQWRVGKVETTLAQLRGTHGQASTEHVRFLALRAQLSSKQHIQEMVVTKLSLREPVQGQVHQM